MNEHAKLKLVKARTNLLLSHFFWGRLALYLQMVEDPKVETLEVDGKHIFYNPDFVLSLSADLIQSAVVHEISHCMFEHISRRVGRNPNVWNYACDYAANLILKDAGFKIGDNWLIDKQYAGMSAERIYDILIQQNDGKGPNGSGKTPLDHIREGAGDKGLSPADTANQEMEWKVAVAQAAHESQKRGDLPASMQRFVDDMLTPKVCWREVLQRFITQISRDDYSWARPNRRFVASGIYAPSLYSTRLGPIVICVDTSGSIDAKTLNAFAAECQSVADQARPEKIKVIYCDAAVNHVDEFQAGELIELHPYGGGGTSFKPPFRLLEELGETPAALIYLTDMWGDFPEEPDFPVLWCATTDQEGPFGETVKIEL